MQLPEPISHAVASLFDTWPLDKAMASLVVSEVSDAAHAVEKIIKAEAIGPDSALAAALWLYVDDLPRSHTISQGIDTPTGSFWHGIMHRREGDFSNSHYWFRKVGNHSVMATIDGYDPHALIDAVAAAHEQGESPDHLVDLQRREWQALFQWCANQS